MSEKLSEIRKADWAKLTPKERVRRVKSMIASRWGTKTIEQKREHARLMAIKRWNKIKCPQE